ncbi:MAG: phage tail sheath family protein [Balneolaceae bacterium]|nr:phage tail sheath family protein [Balneolaceae bacterium]
MPSTLKTPGVYIEEKNAFPNSVVGIPTAVPAFIGYTEKAVKSGGKSAINQPIRITSLAEFHTHFGGGITTKYTIAEAAEGEEGHFTSGGTDYTLTAAENTQAFLYNSIRLFYANGGGTAWIISVGTYADITAGGIKPEKLKKGIEPLVRELEPTMLLIPDALLLGQEDYVDVSKQMLQHCGYKMRNRVAILDVYDGYKDRKGETDIIESFRDAVGSDYLDFGISYYPWIKTTVTPASEIDYENIDNLEALQTALKAEVDKSALKDEAKQVLNDEIDALEVPEVGEEVTEEDKEKQILTEHQKLMSISPPYKELMKELREKMNLLPPGPAMAGIYTMVDNTRGVWKAPANVGIASTVAPSVSITHDEQEDLNVTLTGKSVNAIRAFVGEGVKVWGARTLDGNSQDWRYINVRRTMIFLEQSIKAAAKAYVFEPNDANTWVLMKGMLNNFLNNLWKQGALAGSSPGEAFQVMVGLGETMTPNDILDGIMRITVKVAITRPAEFIVITFQQKMQES